LEQLSKRNKLRDSDATLQRLLDELLDITQEANMLREVKDIHDELEMLRHLFDTQVKVLNDMSDLLEYPGTKIAPHVEKRWRKTILAVEQRRDKVEIMDINANRTFKAINNLFEMKSRQADVLEVHMTRKLAQDSSRQSTTIMVFTVVTIVFLPLSFMSSFFALSVQEFPRDPSNQNQLFMSLSWVSKRVFGIGIGLAALIVVLGFGLNWWNNLPSGEEVFGTKGEKNDSSQKSTGSGPPSEGYDAYAASPSPGPAPLFLGMGDRVKSFPHWKHFSPARKRVVAEGVDRRSMFSYDSYVRRDEYNTPTDSDPSNNTWRSSPIVDEKGVVINTTSELANSKSMPSAPSTLTSFFWRGPPAVGAIGMSPGGRRGTWTGDGDGGAKRRWLFGTKRKTWAPEDAQRKSHV
jgi:hypothetical protein